MARTKLVVTDAYQLASGTAAIFTIKQAGRGQLFFNDVNTDDIAAEKISAATPGAREGLQYEQGLVKNTYVKASEADAGWVILIEEG